jgi:tyrosinase
VRSGQGVKSAVRSYRSLDLNFGLKRATIFLSSRCSPQGPLRQTSMRFALNLTVSVIVYSLLASAASVESSKHRCKKPAVRKEWRALAKSEKADFLEAFKCLAETPRNGKLSPVGNPGDIPPVNTTTSYLDDVSYVHMDLNHQVHFTGLFLPWHRWYLHSLEGALKTECGFKGSIPYWNWSMDASDTEHSPLFDGDLESGLGGWGDPEDDYQITDGVLRDTIVAYPVPHRLRRRFELQPFRLKGNSPLYDNPDQLVNTTYCQSEVDKVLYDYPGDFHGMQAYMEAIQGMHSGVHNVVQGDLDSICPTGANTTVDCSGGPKWSPNDPLFFLHHAMIDKIWYDWQHLEKANKNAYFGGATQMIQNLTIYHQYPTGGPPYLNFDSIMPFDGLFSDKSIGGVMSTTDNELCYTYQ